MNSIMEVWPMPQMPNTIRFVCKLINTGQQHIYDCDKNITITEFLQRVNNLIIRDFNIYHNYSLYFHDTNSRDCILKESNDILYRKFRPDNFINLYVKPDYMYSIPECVFYNSGRKSLRISFLIKKEAAKTIQRFYRLRKQIECPCCFNSYGFSTYNKYYLCNHKICHDCFSQWRERSQTCPCCRANIKSVYRRQINNPRNYQYNMVNTLTNLNSNTYRDRYRQFGQTTSNIITLMDNITFPPVPINNITNIPINQPIENELLEIVEDLRYTISNSNSNNPQDINDSDDETDDEMPTLVDSGQVVLPQWAQRQQAAAGLEEFWNNGYMPS